MIAMDNYPDLLRRTEKAKAEYEQLKGELLQLKKQLKSAYGTDDIAAAKKLLNRLKKRELRAGRTYGRLKAKYEKKWGKILDLPKKD
jgi:uncharacterized protein YlxW (UPF0749 family)